MTNKIKLLATGSCLALMLLGAAPAFAAGTASGSTITNNVTINFQVGGVAQTATTGSNAIIVDRKVAIRVQETGTATTTVVPGQTTAVTTFTVTNDSNATIDIGLTAAQLAGGTAAHGGTDTFDVSGLGMFQDTNGNGTYDAAKGRAAALDRPLRGVLEVSGAAKVAPTDVVTISALPDGHPLAAILEQGTLRVRRVRHQLDVVRGFTTRLEF